MANFVYYLLLIILIIYIISPLDAHPLFLDDLIAAAILFYLLYKKNAKRKKQRRYSYNQSQENKKNASNSPLSLEEAYKLLGITPDASWEEVKKAYKERIAKSHPDKVSHLSKELQDKAKELTLKLNNALDIIKRSKIG